MFVSLLCELLWLGAYTENIDIFIYIFFISYL